MGFYVFHSLVLTNSVSVFIPSLIKFILNIIYILPFCKYPSTYWWVDDSPKGRWNDGVEGEILPYHTNGNMFQKQNKIYMRGANADNDLRMGEFVMCGSVRRLKGLLVILFGFPILYECCYIDVWQFILSWIEIVHCCHCGHPPRRRAGQGSFYTTRNLMLSSI